MAARSSGGRWAVFSTTSAMWPPALSKVGVTFTDAQKKQAKAMMDTGNVAGAQKIILNELNKEFGGSAQAAANTFDDSKKKAKDALDGAIEAA